MAWSLRHPRQSTFTPGGIGEMEYAHGHQRIEAERRLEMRGGAQLAGFQAQAAFEDKMIPFNEPAQAIPKDELRGHGQIRHGQRGDQQPLHGRGTRARRARAG